METVEKIYMGVDEGITLAESSPQGPRRGKEMARVEVIKDLALAVEDGKVADSGPRKEILGKYKPKEIISLGGGVLLPGFVDPHTHPVFYSTREEEFHMRVAGASYVEISRKGGGIVSSIKGVRKASKKELLERVLERLDLMLMEGTTTIEAKSGYGLDTDSEIKSLEVIEEAGQIHPIDIIPTFLGAHEFPPEYRENKDAYVDILCHDMLPKARGHARYADVFTEAHVYDLEQSRKYLERAKELGFGLRVHADEIEPMGGTELAVELGAASADHIVKVSDKGIEALAGSDTSAVLLPTTTFHLGKDDYAPARDLIDAGAIVCLATDFNPGTSYVWSIPLVISVACIKMKMKPEEALVASTINPAFSLSADKEVGTLHPGKKADFTVLDIPSFKALGYVLSSGISKVVVKNGKMVFQRARPEY